MGTRCWAHFWDWKPISGLSYALEAWASACLLMLLGILKGTPSGSEGKFTITAGPPAGSG